MLSLAELKSSDFDSREREKPTIFGTPVAIFFELGQRWPFHTLVHFDRILFVEAIMNSEDWRELVLHVPPIE